MTHQRGLGSASSRSSARRGVYQTTRRNFLASGVGAGLCFWLRGAEAFAQGAGSPKRLLVIHHAVGTVRSAWTCQGQEQDFTLSPILAPFEPLKDQLVVLDGIDIVAPGVGGGHEQGTVTVMTGLRTTELYPGNGGDDPKAAGPSIDQRLLAASKSLQGAPIASLQVSCDDRVDVGEVSTRRLSYAGAAAPLEPYLVPHLTYQRVFGSLMPGQSGAGLDQLARARRLKKSVLDFSLSDLRKLRALAPRSEYERLDAHESAVREIETELEGGTSDPERCGLAQAPPTLEPFLDSAGNRIGNGVYSKTGAEQRDDEKHARIGQLHFDVIRAAFRCDLTRVVTFQWSPGTNHVSFQGMYPGEPSSIKMHHPVSHEFNDAKATEFLIKVDTWYSERTSALLQTLRDTPDLAGGTLLDNTLVPYVTEVARADHSFDDAPFLLFGGPGVRLQTGRLKRYSPRRPVNDMWLACAEALDVTDLRTLGEREMYTGPLDILT
jgi:hypothetical protein